MSYIQYPQVTIRLPEWTGTFLAGYPDTYKSVDERMDMVVALSAENIRHAKGGPFAAAVFDENGKLVAPGVNLVRTENCSILHAEMVAIAIAQKRVGRYDLGDGTRYAFELVTSTEPCSMCFGALHWSGIKRLVCGARRDDAVSIGFDEGPKMAEWIYELNRRGIEVLCDIRRDDARAVLRDYIAAGGIIY